MQIKQILAAAAIAAIGFSTPAYAYDDDDGGGNGPAPQTIAQIIAASGGSFDQNVRDYDILLTAVVTAGLADALNDPNASLTVFAPNDLAFIRLARDLGYMGFSESGAWTYLVGALTMLGNGDPLPVLTNVLLYHVAPGELDVIDYLIAGFTQTPVTTLLAGATFQPYFLQAIDNEPDLANPRVTFPLNIAAVNGRIHTLDRVLIPLDLP
jgi:uncharacterized surface protein with fasciclin (FAS1) repeats